MNLPSASLLGHEPVTASGASPRQWLYVLHGIFGSGRNWGSVARRLVQARPEWGAILVDLREHGASTGFPSPHTVDACVDDLATLAAAGPPATAILGHSFGGKVAMAWTARAPHPRQLWVVDSTPEARPPGGSAWHMLELVRQLPGHFSSRDDLVARLQEGGVALPVARWMATNLAGDPEGGYRWRFNVDAIEELLHDFFRRDLWSVLESPPEGTRIHLVRADDSSVLREEAVARVEALEPRGQVFLHRVAGGHWVNADNPDALHRLLTEQLPAE